MSNKPSYSDVKRAADAQHKSIWAGYLSVGILWNALTYWWQDVPYLGDFMWWGVFIGWGTATIVCAVLSMRVGDREHRARKTALADSSAEAGTVAVSADAERPPGEQRRELEQLLAQRQEATARLAAELEQSMRDKGYTEAEIRSALGDERPT